MIQQTTLPIVIVDDEHSESDAVSQGDCACATQIVDSFDFRVDNSPEDLRWCGNPGTQFFPLMDGWHIALQQSFRAIPAVMNDPARRVLSYCQILRPIDSVYDFFADWDRAILLDSINRLMVCGLIVSEDYKVAHPVQRTSTLTAWLHVTDACNLRCSYCYINKTSESMLLEIGQQAVDAVFRSAKQNNYAAVKIKYAGGEATINLPLVFRLHDYAAKLAEQNHLTLDEVILSNGTLLTAERIEQLKANHIRLMISLDGVNEHHDAQRKFANGKSSFALVARNIDLALEHGLIPDISITISDRNLKGLPETVKYVLDRDLPFSLNFYRENDCSASFEDLNFSEQRIIKAMKGAYKVIEENLPRRSLVGSLIDRASFIAPHCHTCSVGRDYMVIDQRGRIAKCQMEITKTVTDIHADDPLQLIRADQIGIQNKSVEEKQGCHGCEWRYWCAGGCPLATYRATGHYDVKSPNCEIYKALFPEVLRLEGLRIIKHAEE